MPGTVSETFTPARRTGGTECCVCELPIEHHGFAIPMYEGEPVSARNTALLEEAGDFACCRKCYEAYIAADLVGLKIRRDAIKDMGIVRARVNSLVRAAKDFIETLEIAEI